MRRLTTLGISVAIIFAAYSLSPPLSDDPDLDVATTVAEETASVSRFFHCPWAFADDNAGSVFTLMATEESDFRLSFPENGEVEEGESNSISEGAAIAVPNERILGASSAIVEFSDGPAAAAVVAIAPDLLAGDVCSSTLPAVWHVAGGSTREGDSLILRLFNPFADDAQVSITAVSELGIEADDSFEAVSVPARSTRTFALEDTLPGREVLSLFVEQLSGSVIPVMVQETGVDVAVWPGTRHSEVWEFPLVRDGDITTELILTNAAPIGVAYTVEVFDETATVLSSRSGVIDGRGQARVLFDEIDAAVFGVRVAGDGPFGAVVVGRSETSAVGAVGAPAVSRQWLVPGPNSQSSASYSLWFLNTGVESVTVAYRRVTVTGDGLEATVTVAAGAAAMVDVTDVGSAGIIVTGSGPVSVAWSASQDGRRMFSGAVAVGG